MAAEVFAGEKPVAREANSQRAAARGQGSDGAALTSEVPVNEADVADADDRVEAESAAAT